MTQRRLHFEAAVPQQQLRQRRQSRRGALSGVVVLAALVLAAWNVSGLSIAPGRLEYGALHVGAGSEVRPVVLTNRSSSDVHPAVKVLGEAASDFSFSDEACATIKGGETCRLPVQFRPHESGLRSARLAVTLDDGQSATAELAGEALPVQIEFLPHTLDFHQVTVGFSSGEQRVRLTGVEDLRIAAASLEGEGSLDYRVGRPACGGNPNTGTECSIPISLMPRREGETTANLVVRLEGHMEPYRVMLRGEGIRPQLAASPTPIPTPIVTPVPTPSPVRTPRPVPQAMMRFAPLEMDFSAEPRQPQQVQIWNDGNAPLRINAALVGQDAGLFQMTEQPCPQVPPHGDCLIPVRLRPARGKREYQAVLRLEHSASNIGSPQEVTLRWTSPRQVKPPRPKPPQDEASVQLAVQPSSLNFSGETRGRTAASLPPQTITIRNLGPGSVQNLSLRLGMFGGGENKYFHHSSNCRALGPGESCQETVSFSAAAATSYRETLYLTDGPLKVLATVPLSATLAGPAPPPQPPQPPQQNGGSTPRIVDFTHKAATAQQHGGPTPSSVQNTVTLPLTGVFRPRVAMAGPTPTATQAPTPTGIRVKIARPRSTPTPNPQQMQRVGSMRKMVRRTPMPTPTPVIR